ncbi:MAG: hypothetical protein AAF138_06585 [Planctomycetota bacterium]
MPDADSTIDSTTQEPTGGLPGVLFTAFEPSGDEHAAVVIAELRARHPDLAIYAWGGPKMAAAGATVIERTGDDAVMGLPGWEKIQEHRRLNKRVGAWMTKGLASVHVPVDSPAANFPICKLAKKHGLKVVHLVAPQVWAWGSWRIRKLRRLTDLVLCVLPFEEGWFRERGVNARFVGHPMFTEPLDIAALDAAVREMPDTHPRIALLPGSRPGELERNFPVLLEVFGALRADTPGLTGMIAATNQRAADRLVSMGSGRANWPEGLDIAIGRADAVLRWADVAAVASGTVTLRVARHGTPMTVFYKTKNRALYTVPAPMLFEAEFFTLPNLVAGREIAPEVVPMFGSPEPVIAAMRELLHSPERAEEQRAALAEVVEAFGDRRADRLAADAIEEIAGIPRATPRVVPPEPVRA